MISLKQRLYRCNDFKLYVEWCSWWYIDCSKYFYQQKLDFNSQETGYISLTYLIAVLIMIRVGEMILQSLGPKRPLLLGSALTVIGLILLSLTFYLMLGI